MTTLSLGISPCPNDLYIFSGLLLGHVADIRVQPSFHDVQTLNQRALAGELDLVKVSYAHVPRCTLLYDLLPSGGALGRGVGPLLLVHGEQWSPDREVLVPGKFTTANFLLDFYCQRPLQKKFLAFDTLYETLCRTPGAQGVVINEKRFTYGQDGLRLVCDLGVYWEQETGGPIPLGALLARKPLEMSSQINQWVLQSLAWADQNRPEALALCRQYAADESNEAIEAHIALYVNEYTRELGQDGRRAVEFFFQNVPQ